MQDIEIRDIDIRNLEKYYLILLQFKIEIRKN